ncbi:MAG: nicotinate (nicotinamide) nucleotide adenylyltransferase [Endomicrobium sp.]|jgi:nicotinate-nucleotide adenylyltransferase|nr:nicotinate (nicotinamide) nucleotide adenylyltransferase [Endomicrobium sp.]
MDKVAVFGGSFDPVHNAHIQIAELALSVFKLKKLIFVIAYMPPHKIRSYANVQDRIKMLNIAIKGLKKTEISLFEILRQETVYSYETLNYFQDLYPEDEIYMIIGSDSLIELPMWKNIDYLANKYKFMVAKRPGIEISKNTKYLDRTVFIDKEIKNISSTKIRKLIKENSKNASFFLNDKVYNYIIKNKIYK